MSIRKLRSLCATVVLFSLFAAQAYAGPPIVGSWKVTIENDHANSPAIFLLSLTPGNIVNIAQANGHRSVAFGHWNKVGGQTFRIQDTHLHYAEESPFGVIATEEHFVEVELARDGMTFAGSANLVVTDLNGNVLSDIVLPIVGNRLSDPDF